MHSQGRGGVDVLILGEPEGWYCRELQRQALLRGDHCDVVPFAGWATRLGGSQSSEITWAGGEAPRKTRPFQSYDVCLVRAMPPGSLEQVVLRMDVLWSLQQAGVRVVNPPKGLECAIDKYLTLARCQQIGLPIPETVCCETAEQAWEQFREWGEAVVKPVFGAEGRGVLHLTDAETAWRVFRALEQIQAVIYLQRFLSSEQGDVRLLMLDGTLLGAMRRTATRDFRTNVSQQGQAWAYEAPPEVVHMAREACRAVGVVLGGVDLLQDRQGNWHLLEVNGCPGWKALAEVTGIDVPQELFAWLDRSC